MQVQVKPIHPQESQEDLAEVEVTTRLEARVVQMLLEIQNQLKVMLAEQLITLVHIMEPVAVAEQVP